MRIFLCLLTVLFLMTHCKRREVTEDASLFGTWSDDLVRYTFKSNMEFGKKSLVPDPFDSLQIDSSWGTFEVYNNELLVFTFNGYRLKNKVEVDSTYLGPTWNYTIEGNLMRYQSSTAIGTLMKIN